MKASLKPGLQVNFTYQVPTDRTVPHLLPESREFSLMPEVLATGYMVGLFEWACIVALNPHLDGPNEQTVGTHVNLSHSAATPPGLTLHIQGELVSVQGRKLVFDLEADDGVDRISKGICSYLSGICVTSRASQSKALKASWLFLSFDV